MLLCLYQESEDSFKDSEDRKETEFALLDVDEWSSNGSTDNDGDGNFAVQFDICLQRYLDTPNEIAKCDETGEVVSEISIHSTTTEKGTDAFHGACLDTGASTSVCGIR